MATNELIGKLKEKIKHLESYDSLCDFDQLKAWLEKKHQLESDITALESQAKEPSDEDIEKWAENSVDVYLGKDWQKIITDNRIFGAKAMRDGKIKTQTK